jgi:Cytochrome P460
VLIEVVDPEGGVLTARTVTLKSPGKQALPRKQKKGSAMKRKNQLTIATAIATLAVLGGTGFYAAQDKYALKSPSGIAFSDFRGYEDWAVVSSARTDEVLKVIVANPTMIKAYKSGIPGNGKPFPDGSKIAKLQWKPKKSTEAPFVVDVPDVFKQAFVIEKDSKRFPKSGGWGYALFNYDAATDKFSADPTGVSDCGHACHVKVKAKDHIFHPYQKR